MSWLGSLLGGRPHADTAAAARAGAVHPAEPINHGEAAKTYSRERARIIREQDRLWRGEHSTPSRDEFDRWLDDPVTRFVKAGLARNAEECREEWVRKSWDVGESDEFTLHGLRERADALMGLVEADYEAWCETLGVEPEGKDEH
jgi:hypothetical protein